MQGNFIQVAFMSSVGDEFALRQLDIGCMMVIIHKIAEDPNYIREIKHEFIRNKFYNEINGEDLFAN